MGPRPGSRQTEAAPLTLTRTPRCSRLEAAHTASGAPGGRAPRWGRSAPPSLRTGEGAAPPLHGGGGGGQPGGPGGGSGRVTHYSGRGQAETGAEVALEKVSGPREQTQRCGGRGAQGRGCKVVAACPFSLGEGELKPHPPTQVRPAPRPHPRSLATLSLRGPPRRPSWLRTSNLRAFARADPAGMLFSLLPAHVTSVQRAFRWTHLLVDSSPSTHLLPRKPVPRGLLCLVPDQASFVRAVATPTRRLAQRRAWCL